MGFWSVLLHDDNVHWLACHTRERLVGAHIETTRVDCLEEPLLEPGYLLLGWSEQHLYWAAGFLSACDTWRTHSLRRFPDMSQPRRLVVVGKNLV